MSAQPFSNVSRRLLEIRSRSGEGGGWGPIGSGHMEEEEDRWVGFLDSHVVVAKILMLGLWQKILSFFPGDHNPELQWLG